MTRFRRCRYPGCHAMVQLPDHYCQQHYEHEAEYLANRQRWARSHNRQYQHRYNTLTRNRNSVKHDQYQFYRSRQWQRLREQVLERDHYICQYCSQPNSNTVDHIVPIEYDEALKTNLNNLATICCKCHRLKTDWEHEWYGTGIDNQRKQVAELHDVLSIKYLMTKGYQ
ncbi:HNH endonuclease [Limosilactobacillus sp. c11Ua_112_M]|uniref:HNH endonuclease n=1 Tax=Limosilactobacillus portuensis TaxID=2742601 RepID=UPI001782C550|nr:HNH endonuclease [Limosilactobacillus portuensis]MBD8087951.1 HNH endonuclease [Limosilactobacillus portuensis]